LIFAGYCTLDERVWSVVMRSQMRDIWRFIYALMEEHELQMSATAMLPAILEVMDEYRFVLSRTYG
jgi:hypothetical protein